MNRREWFHRAAVVATSAIAVDQLELLERLSHKKVFAGADFADPFSTDKTMFFLDGGSDTYIWKVQKGDRSNSLFELVGRDVGESVLVLHP